MTARDQGGASRARFGRPTEIRPPFLLTGTSCAPFYAVKNLL